MYAVVKSGGKQYRVHPGQRVRVERLAESGATVDLTPVLLVDGDTVLATPDQLAGATVSATVVDEGRGRKINGFDYKAKARVRRRWGHRQAYSTIEITDISRG
ncbi:MAG: 50S ribosomal protein L21 [Actinobacteria bacterium]|nr:50S ribosomal protein L21 [Actinomycetota bacterium]